MGFRLSGAMIPRRVKRMFEQREDVRVPPDPNQAMLGWRGKSQAVQVVNVSDGGAMLLLDEVPHIGERVTLQLVDRGLTAGQVRWVRDGRVGVNFS